MDTKIAIGLPTNRGVKPQTVLSLLNMVAHTKVDYHIIVSTKGYNTAENRNFISAQAVKNNCTHLLLTDDDMIYEPDSLDKLLEAKKDIVGAKYSVRSEVEKGVEAEVIEYLDGEDTSKLFRCNSIGGGLLLIKTSVFKKIEQPFFWYEIYDNGMVRMSNDWWFCRNARKFGVDIWCQPEIKPSHRGDYVF